MKLPVEFLSLGTNSASAATTWGLWRSHPVTASSRSGCHFGVFVDCVELINLVVDTVHGLVDVVELVSWVPCANSLLAVIEFALQGKIALVLLDKQVSLERLDLIWCLINVKEELDIIALLGAFDQVGSHL